MQNIEENYSATFENLLKQGFVVVDVRYKTYKLDNEGLKFVIIKVDQDRDTFYANMLKSLLETNNIEKNMYELWFKILLHKLKMSECLNRDVSIKVAALDYLNH